MLVLQAQQVPLERPVQEPREQQALRVPQEQQEPVPLERPAQLELVQRVQRVQLVLLGILELLVPLVLQVM